MKSIRLGIIGCGGMSRHHGRVMTQQVKGYEVVALCDTHAENLARYQKEIFDPLNQQPPTFADYRDMLAKVDLDAVLIVTPHTHHFAQTMDSLAAGLHVLVEKPMVTAVAEARQVIAEARRRRRVVMIGFPGTFTPEFGFIQQYIRAGKLGAVRLIDAWSAQNWLQLTRGTWRQDPKLSGGGQAYDTGAHMFHGLLYLTGLQLQEVCARVENFGTPVDINSVATIKFRNGALATATVSGADCVQWDNAIYISGERGSVRTQIHGGKLELWDAEGRPVKYPRVEPVPTLHENFRDCVRGRGENLCPPLWGLRQALLMEAFYRSARTGRPVPRYQPSDGEKIMGRDASVNEVSISPAGEEFPLPKKEEYAGELARLEKLAAAARKDGKEIVVVMGVGFVGAVMAAIVADTPKKFVIGCQRPSSRSYWKIPLINRGVAPVKAEDPEVEKIIARTVNEKGTLTATFNSDCLKLADCVVVDVQCDYKKNALGNMRDGEADMGALEATMKTIGQKIPAKCLVLIETTVAPGTTEFVAWPILKRAFAARGIKTEPLLAHSFERVMPGREYVSSIRDFWRVCSGCNPAARKRVEKFLRQVLNTKDFPLTVMDRPIESETTKIVENSYRAAILAYLHEWSLFAERNGVDLIKVIKAIKVRPTHSNIIFPGPGIGGYCLPKDGGLGYWAYKHILGFEDGDNVFKITPTAIDINDTRALHVAELTRDALRNMGRYIAGAEVLICGASYRQDVGDTRYSGSELVVRKLTEMGAEMRVHDPYVEHWYELEAQDNYPAPGHSWSRFFRNQDELKNARVQPDIKTALKSAEAVIFAVPHRQYLELKPDNIVKWAGKKLAIIDCYGILSDDTIRRYFELGCEVKALGRGHIQRLKEEVRRKVKR